MSEFVHAPRGTLAEKGSAVQIANRIARLDIISVSEREFIETVNTAPGTWECHPVTGVGIAADQYQVVDTVTEDGIQPDDTWQTTTTYVDDFTHAKGEAKRELRAYYRSFVSSQFVAGARTYPAIPIPDNLYLTIEASRRADAAGFAAKNYYVYDISDISVAVTSTGDWDGFWTKYENLYKNAANNAETVWATIAAIPTDPPPADGVDQIRAAMATLPAVPGS